MGATDPGSLPLSPERDSRALLLGSSTCPATMGIAPDPMQYPDSWYITRLNRTLESHTTLYQYIINHQMQADSIAQHLGTTLATIVTYESFVEILRTFCQTIDHANHKAIQEKSRRKALQAEFEQSGRRGQGNCTNPRSGRGEGRGWNPGRGRSSSSSSGRGNGRTGGRYHNWIPRDQFDNWDDAGYEQLIRDRVARGELQANNKTRPHLLHITIALKCNLHHPFLKCKSPRLLLPTPNLY